ncbi:hypothetical protein [Terrarubrum flagellatum]|uniref:hypothetical protein n=1 Tax=Terrirubrum flagellatum TaxID=2895980 RepID=UPI00314537C2
MTSGSTVPVRMSQIRIAGVAAAVLALGACSSSGSSGAPSSGQPGNALSNLFFWGSPTVPPAPPLPEDSDFECPSVTVAANGAAYRVGGDTVRVQYSMGDTARECTNVQRDGSFTLKVGAEGRVLLGAAGSPGRYDVTVRFVVKANEKPILTRVQRQSVVIPAGATQGSFVMVEQGIQVPPNQRDLEIEVGFGAGGAPAAPRQRRAARR